jgi:ABC-type nitrate/sulfonate/bicarbonate transport system substrate-binding protein
LRIEKKTLNGASVILTLVILAACGRSSKSSDKQFARAFRWGGPTNISMLAIVAQQKGLFRAVGLDTQPIYLQTGKMAMDAVVSGDLDVGIIVETNIALIQYQPGTDVRVIAEVMKKHDDALLARADKGIRKPTDLYGKTIAIVPATTSHRFADRFIDFYKLDRSRIRFLNSTPPGIQSGLLNGDLVAGSIWEPFRYNLQKALGTKIVQFQDRAIYTSYVLAAMRKATLVQEHARAELFLRGLVAAQRYVRDHPEESINLLAKEIGMEPGVLTAIWSDYEFGVGLSPELQSVFDDAGRWAKTAETSLASAPVPSYANVIDPSVLKAAQAGATAAVAK